MQYRVKTWYDTITPESAERCDYASHGNDMRERLYDDLAEAIDAALDHLNCLNNESDLNEFKADPIGYGRLVVLYSSDPVTDYVTADEDMYTAAIEVIK